MIDKSIPYREMAETRPRVFKIKILYQFLKLGLKIDLVLIKSTEKMWRVKFDKEDLDSLKYLRELKEISPILLKSFILDRVYGLKLEDINVLALDKLDI